MTSGLHNLRRSGRGAFTLVEILVVLGIMVVLFALLFIPMTSGLQMASTGRTNAAIQQSLRLALEQVQRDLSEAVYVYPPELIWTPGGAAGPGDDTAIVNYSTVTMIPPARDPISGNIEQPVRPATWSNGNLMAIRYAVHTPQVDLRGPLTLNGQAKWFEIPTKPWEENALALYRQQGECRWDPELRTYTFGSLYDPGGGPVFVINWAVAENAVTPRMGADIVATKTVSQRNGSLGADGWVSWDDAAAATLTLPLTYIYGAVQFKPERVENEYATPASNAPYSLWARRGAWEGLEDRGDGTLWDIFWGEYTYKDPDGALINNSEVRPRIVVWRAGIATPVLDTDLLSPANPASGLSDAARSLLKLRYNSRSGEVWTGSYVETQIDVDAAGAGTVTAYGEDGVALGIGAVDAALAPASYVLQPSVVDPWGNTPARTRGVPDTMRVWVSYVLTAGGVSTAVRRDYSVLSYATRPVATDLAALGQWEVALTHDEATEHDTILTLDFNPNLPPAPSTLAPDWSSFPAGTVFRPGDLVTQTGGQVYRCVTTTDTTDAPPSANWAEATIAAYQVHVGFIVRRNWDPDNAAGADDRIAVSYSTAGMYNVKLALSAFNRYEPVVSGSVVQVPIRQGAQVVYSSQVAVPNLAR